MRKVMRKVIMKNRFNIIFTGLLFFVLVVCAEAAEKNIYFDSSASRGGNGSIESPYDDLSDINWTIVQEWVNAGHTVYLNLKKSSTFSEQLTIGASGASGRAITIKPYGSGIDPIITGSSIGINSKSKDYITLDSIIVSNQTSKGMRLYDCSNWIIQNCIFTDSAKDAIAIEWVATDGGGGCDDNSISSNTFTGWDIVIYTKCTGAGSSSTDTFHNFEIDGNTGTGTNRGFHQHFEVDYRNAHVDGGRIISGYVFTDNILTTLGHYAIGVYLDDNPNNLIARNSIIDSGDADAYSTNTLQMHALFVIIEDNYINGVKKDGTGDGHAIVLDWVANPGHATNTHADGCIVRRNYITNALEGSGLDVYVAKNTEVYNNVIVGNDRGIVIRRITNTGNVFYGNTISDNVSSGVFLWDNVPATTWANNIITGNGAYGFEVTNGSTNPTETYTLHYGNTNGFSNTFRADATDINSDPKFVDSANGDYSLQTTSPCRDAGTSIAGDVALTYGHRDTTDWSTTPPTIYTLVQHDHGSGWEIGAYVYIDDIDDYSEKLEAPLKLKVKNAEN